MWEKNAEWKFTATIQALETIPFESRGGKRPSVGLLPMKDLGRPRKVVYPARVVVIPRQFQPQVLVGATTTPLPLTEAATVPVQALQVQQALVHRLVTRLVHPQHAVHTLPRTAGAHRPAQPPRHGLVRLPP